MIKDVGVVCLETAMVEEGGGGVPHKIARKCRDIFSRPMCSSATKLALLCVF